MKWLQLELNGYQGDALPEGITVGEAEKLAWRSGRYYKVEIPSSPHSRKAAF